MVKLLLENRNASALELKEKFEAGLVLTGAEVKALRQKNGSLSGAFVRVVSNEALVFGFHVGRYLKAGHGGVEENRERKLLLTRDEIDRILGLISRKGFVCVPLKLYLKQGLIKMEIGLGRMLRRWQRKAKPPSRTVPPETGF